MGMAVAGGVQAPAWASPAASSTVQQLFDAAAAATRADRADEALSLYETIERRLRSGGSRASLAVTRARKGVLLVSMGRGAEAEAPLTYAMERLDPADDGLRDDRYMVAWSRARLRELALDYPGARRDYATAGREATMPADVRAMQASQVRVMQFDDAPAALRLADQALAGVTADPAATKEMRAQYRTLRGRVLLNLGDYPAAATELQRALRELGGLTNRVNLADISARSDMAIAAMLKGDADSARRFLAFTGAGTQVDVLSPAADIAAPPCGGAADLRPQDVAVVEFSIAEDGHVSGVSPIYVSRSGPAALAFARAVASWSWTREEAARIKPFFRMLVRVEVRCSTASDRPNARTLLMPAVGDWLRSRDVAPYEPTAPSATLALPMDEAELERREAAAGPMSPALLPPMIVIAGNPTTATDRRIALTRRAAGIAEAAQAPAAVRAFIGAGVIDADMRSVTTRSGGLARASAFAALAAQPIVSVDPQARSAVKLLQADAFMLSRRGPEAVPVLEAIVADPALPPRDPMKVGALLRLASVRAAAGDLAAARAAYERTGLAAQECALVDAQPALVNDNAGAGSFPQEAMRWGFEGWARTEFDIGADGRTANVRSIIAYPPFVFSPGSVAVMSGARFTQSYRPEGGLGCGGLQRTIRFGLPGFK